MIRRTDSINKPHSVSRLHLQQTHQNHSNFNKILISVLPR
uniref:Uncharacterized protein n=1 Tax=Arundo donax TaxID=35708 RepID=A0A0A8ZVL7_ARUDO